MQPPRVVLSYGLGADSTAVLLRWLTDPTSRDFDLTDLLVITAQTGSEWEVHRELVERHILPLLRRHGVRYAQVARRGRSQRDGVAILDDSRAPTRVHLEGAYTLATEMLTAGTVPQTHGARLCSMRSKGWPIETFLATATAGLPYRHVMGFELGEAGRADRDTTYNTATRTGEYPLIAWAWDRARCLEFIKALLGVDWPKSSCRFCPFALANLEGRARVLAQFRADPPAALEPLVMEHVSVALNPAQGLLKRRRLVEVMRAEPGLEAALDHYERHLDAARWAVYEVRRALRPRRDDPAKLANAVRSVRAVHAGGRADTAAELAVIAARLGLPVDRGDGQHPRVWVRRRGATFPSGEHFYVAAPAAADDKDGPGFADAYEATLLLAH
jgi:hypothetical protein